MDAFTNHHHHNMIITNIYICWVRNFLGRVKTCSDQGIMYYFFYFSFLSFFFLEFLFFSYSFFFTFFLLNFIYIYIYFSFILFYYFYYYYFQSVDCFAKFRFVSITFHFAKWRYYKKCHRISLEKCNLVKRNSP